MATVMAIISVIRELIGFIKILMDLSDKKRIADVEKRRQALAQATEDLKNAKTDEEIWDAQKRIVDNSP